MEELAEPMVYPVNQGSYDLIYSISTSHKNCIIAYSPGGFYDRILESVKDYQGKGFPDQEENQWVLARKQFWFHLQIPGRHVSRSYGTPEKKYKDTKVNGTVQIYMYTYRSVVNSQLMGFTFGSKSYKMIKPLKVMNHNWAYLPEESWDGYSATSSERKYKCKKCQISGISNITTNVIEPVDFVTCDEAMIKDIIL